MAADSGKATIRVTRGGKVTVKEATTKDVVVFFAKELIDLWSEYFLQKQLANESFDVICFELRSMCKAFGVICGGTVPFYGVLWYLMLNVGEKIDQKLKEKKIKDGTPSYWLAHVAGMLPGFGVCFWFNKILLRKLFDIADQVEEYKKKNDGGQN